MVITHNAHSIFLNAIKLVLSQESFVIIDALRKKVEDGVVSCGLIMVFPLDFIKTHIIY